MTEKELISVLVPAFNEEKGISPFLLELKKEISKVSDYVFEIIVIEDGSTDNTFNVLKKCSGIKVLYNPYNMGYGASLKRGMRAANGKYVMIIDADMTYNPKDLPTLLEHLKDYDMVVGARIGKNAQIPSLRRPAKFILRKFAEFLSGKKIPDLNSGFRIFKKDLALRFEDFYPSGFSLTTTITLLFFGHDYTVKYVPINYHKRIGESSIHPINDFMRFITLTIRMIIIMNPFKFFVIPGVTLMLIGLIMGIIEFATHINLWGTALVLVTGGMNIFFLGILADLITKRLTK